VSSHFDEISEEPKSRKGVLPSTHSDNASHLVILSLLFSFFLKKTPISVSFQEWKPPASEWTRPQRTPNIEKSRVSQPPQAPQEKEKEKRKKSPKSERRKRESDSEEEEEEEEDWGEWYFKCLCGKAGKNYNDDTEMIACEICDVWQHIECNGLKKAVCKCLFLPFLSRVLFFVTDFILCFP